MGWPISRPISSPSATAPTKARSISQTTAGSDLRVIVKTARIWDSRPCFAGSASLASLGAAVRAMCEGYFQSGKVRDEGTGNLPGGAGFGEVHQLSRHGFASALHRLGPQPARAV